MSVCSIGMVGDQLVRSLILELSPRSTLRSTGRISSGSVSRVMSADEWAMRISASSALTVAAGADVIRLAGFSGEHQSHGRRREHREVATSLVIADGDGICDVRLGSGDSAGDGRGDEGVGLAGPEMVERPDSDDFEVIGESRLDTDQVSGGFGYPVGAHGPEWVCLGERHVGLGHLAVEIGAGDGDHSSRAGDASSVEDVERTFGVDTEGLHRSVPRATDIGLGGEVIDDVGLGCGEFGDQRVAVGDVRCARDFDVTRPGEQLAEVSSDES